MNQMRFLLSAVSISENGSYYDYSLIRDRAGISDEGVHEKLVNAKWISQKNSEREISVNEAGRFAALSYLNRFRNFETYEEGAGI